MKLIDKGQQDNANTASLEEISQTDGSGNNGRTMAAHPDRQPDNSRRQQNSISGKNLLQSPLLFCGGGRTMAFRSSYFQIFSNIFRPCKFANLHICSRGGGCDSGADGAVRSAVCGCGPFLATLCCEPFPLWGTAAPRNSVRVKFGRLLTVMRFPHWDRLGFRLGPISRLGKPGATFLPLFFSLCRDKIGDSQGAWVFECCVYCRFVYVSINPLLIPRDLCK